jgi:hypothetical protein
MWWAPIASDGHVANQSENEGVQESVYNVTTDANIEHG